MDPEGGVDDGDRGNESSRRGESKDPLSSNSRFGTGGARGAGGGQPPNGEGGDGNRSSFDTSVKAIGSTMNEGMVEEDGTAVEDALDHHHVDHRMILAIMARDIMRPPRQLRVF
eukprot:2348114-Amphidinium_carterae.1